MKILKTLQVSVFALTCCSLTLSVQASPEEEVVEESQSSVSSLVAITVLGQEYKVDPAVLSALGGYAEEHLEEGKLSREDFYSIYSLVGMNAPKAKLRGAEYQKKNAALLDDIQRIVSQNYVGDEEFLKSSKCNNDSSSTTSKKSPLKIAETVKVDNEGESDDDTSSIDSVRGQSDNEKEEEITEQPSKTPVDNDLEGQDESKRALADLRKKYDALIESKEGADEAHSKRVQGLEVENAKLQKNLVTLRELIDGGVKQKEAAEKQLAEVKEQLAEVKKELGKEQVQSKKTYDELSDEKKARLEELEGKVEEQKTALEALKARFERLKNDEEVNIEALIKSIKKELMEKQITLNRVKKSDIGKTLDKLLKGALKNYLANVENATTEEDEEANPLSTQENEDEGEVDKKDD